MKLSIVTVCRNAAATIGATLDSVAAQDWPDLEHIVVDGLSTDATLDIIAAHAHPRLAVSSERDDGIYAAMNKGLARATGDFVAFLNADDRYARPDVARRIVERVAQSGADCIFGDTQFIYPDGTRARRIYSVARYRRWWMRIGVSPPHPSTFVRRELLLAAGGFDARYRIAADVDLMARLLLRDRASFATIPLVLTEFTTGGTSTNGRAARQQITSETAASLAALGLLLPNLSARARFAIKIGQVVLPARHE